MVIDNSTIKNANRFQFAKGGAGATEYNTLIITNGARVQLNGLNFYAANITARGNRVIETGSNSWVSAGGSAIVVGANGTNNTMTIERGAVVTNASINVAGSDGYFNSLVVTNGGLLFATASANSSFIQGGVRVGSGNSFVVDGSYAMFNNALIMTVCNGISSGNWMGIQNQGIVTNIGTLNVVSAVGTNASGNYVSVTGGSRLYTTLASTLVNHPGAVGNYVLVSGAGSLWDNGGTLLTLGSGTGNYVRVEQGGQLTVSGLNVSNQNGNTVTNAGGVLEFTTSFPTVTLGAPATTTPGVSVIGGVVSFRGALAANVKGNWYGSPLTNVTFSGANAFRLNNAANLANTLTNQTYWFDTIAGAPTNYAGLELVNGNTSYTNGTIGIGTNGWLTFSNTTATIWGAVTNYGALRVYNSSVTFKTNLYLGDSTGSVMTWGTSSLSSPFTVLGTLRIPSVLNFSAAGSVGATNSVTLFTANGGIVGSPGNWTVLPNSHRVSVSPDGHSLVLVPRLPGFLFYVK